MSDVRWEPIPPGEAVDYDMTIGSNSELRVVTELGEMVVEFDDDIRLCRAVAAPTWSQEPPTEPGWWWFFPLPWDRPPIWLVETYSVTVDRDGGVRIGADTELYTGGIQWADEMLGYWLPAAVPQPPGEVGP